MKLAEDDRARVPFALVGVLLLVASATLSASLVGSPEPTTNRSVGDAIDRTTAASHTAIRGAVERAGRRAATNPVTATANTTFGRVVNDSTPFRDSLRIRIYLAVRNALDDTSVEVGDVTASPSLPATPNASALRAAKRRVHLERAGERGASGLRVRIENVSVTATRGQRAVERTAFSPTLVVATPALALHDRVERFENRLNRGPLSPGLGRRLTTRLYAVGWARGYAQYGKAPIENVIANRHVELATNDAVLREQRVAFGRSDPAGRRALGWATARVGATDFLEAVHAQRQSARTHQLLTAARKSSVPPSLSEVGGGRTLDAPPNRFRVGVDRTADRAFGGLVSGGDGGESSGPGLATVLREAYATDVRLIAAVSTKAEDARPEPRRPGTNWTLEDERVRTTVRVEDADGPTPESSEERHRIRAGTREVVRNHALVARWTRGNETRRTVRAWSERYRVGVGIAGDHRDASRAPARPVAGVHERGGPLDGLNLRDVPRKATDRLITGRGGFDRLARRAVEGTLDTRSVAVTGDRPSSLREWVRQDLRTLRERVRNVTVDVPRESVVTGRRNPDAALVRKLRARKDELVDAPARYDGVADRARVAARVAYLDRVIARLETRANRTDRTRSGVERALSNAGVAPSRLRRIAAAKRPTETPPTRPMPAAGPGSPANLTVEGAPPYLTLTALDRERVAAVPEGETRYPLAARNVNVFTVPYADATDTVVDRVDGARGSDEVDLQTAGAALRAANRTLAETSNRTLTERRAALRAALAASLHRTESAFVRRLGDRLDLSVAERRAAVRAGFGRWDTTHARALAVANGSVANVVAAEIADSKTRRAAIRPRVRTALESTRRHVEGPPESAVGKTSSTARTVARREAKRVLGDALDRASETARKRWFGEVLSSVPAGLPVTPVPGHWYATANVWHVAVRGQYARFTVRAPRGSPLAPGGTVAYTRRAEPVRIDADGDGETETLGRTTPVSFETSTVVVVVVPPGPPGVGDTDGDADERSTGWSASE